MIPRLITACWAALFLSVVAAVSPAGAAEWVVVAVTGQEPRVIEAAKVEEAGGMVTLRDANGKALGAWQQQFISGRAAQLPASREQWTEAAIRKQADELEAFATKYPVAAKSVKPAVDEARAYLRQLEEKIAAAAASQKLDLQKRLEAVLAVAAPARTAPPEVVFVQGHIQEVRALMAALPEEAARLEEHLKPWKEIGDALAAGQVWFEDQWKTREEIETLQEERARKAAVARMEKVATMEISGTVVTAEDMGKVKIAVIASVSLGFLALLSLLVWKTNTTTVVHTKTQGEVRLKHSSGLLGMIRILLVLAALVMVGAESFYVYRLWFGNPGAVPVEMSPATSDDLIRILYASSRPEGLKAVEVPRAVAITAADLNAHLAKHLVFTGDPGPGALVRTTWAVDVSPQAITFQENLRCDGRSWTALYQIILTTEEAGTRFSTGAVTLDGLPVPKLLGGMLWNSFQSELQRWAEATNLKTHYTFAGVDEDKLKATVSTMPPVVP